MFYIWDYVIQNIYPGTLKSSLGESKLKIAGLDRKDLLPRMLGSGYDIWRREE